MSDVDAVAREKLGQQEDETEISPERRWPS